MMKTKGICLVCALLLLTACGKMYEYKHLDGMWQMRHIAYEEGGTSEPENSYYSFQRHVINVRNMDSGECFGIFRYTDDSLHVSFQGASVDAMGAYGMNDTVQHFRVEKLTGSQLILKSDYARLEFRKY